MALPDSREASYTGCTRVFANALELTSEKVRTLWQAPQSNLLLNIQVQPGSAKPVAARQVRPFGEFGPPPRDTTAKVRLSSTLYSTMWEANYENLFAKCHTPILEM